MGDNLMAAGTGGGERHINPRARSGGEDRAGLGNLTAEQALTHPVGVSSHRAANDSVRSSDTRAVGQPSAIVQCGSSAASQAW